MLLKESPAICLFLHTQANAKQCSCSRLLLLSEENRNRKLHPRSLNSFTSGPGPQVTTLLVENTISSLRRMTIMASEMLTSDIIKKAEIEVVRKEDLIL